MKKKGRKRMEGSGRGSRNEREWKEEEEKKPCMFLHDNHNVTIPASLISLSIIV